MAETTTHPTKRIVDFDAKRSDLEKKLRQYHKTFSSFASNGKIQLQQKKMSNGQLSYGFDLDQPYFYNFKDHVFFEDPDVQLEFFNRISAALEQEVTTNLKTSLYSDQKTKMIQEQMVLKNNPSCVKQLLINCFNKRMSILELKKKKTFSRYSSFAKLSRLKIDSNKFLISRIKLIEIEQAHLHRRLKRLKIPDNFSESQQEGIDRPIAINDAGDEVYQSIQDGELCFSNISREDFEVFNRATIFDNVIKRDLWKFYYVVKWIHYSERKAIFDHIHTTMSSFKAKSEHSWKKYVTDIEGFFISKAKDTFPSQHNELKSIISKLFSQMKSFNREEGSEFNYLDVRNDTLPLWPSTVLESNAQLIKAAELFFEGMIDENEEIQKLIFKMNIIIEIVYDNQLDIEETIPLEGSDESENSEQQQINKRIKENQNKDKMFLLEEGSIKTQMQYMIVDKKSISIVESEWNSMLDFTPNYDEIQHNVLSKLKEIQCPIDSISQLIISNLGNKDVSVVKRMISEITKQIMTSCEDKFFLFIENKKYFDKSHYSISYELLVDTYKEGLKESKPFDTSKSKRLESKEAIKKEFLNPICQVLNEQKPGESVLESAYLLTFLKCKENRRKILNSTNAIRSIQRRVTYDLIKTFNCDLPNHVDEGFIFNVSDGKREELLLQQQKREAHSSRKQPSQNKERRSGMKSFNESKNHFDQRYKRQLNPDVLLGRCDTIVYENDLRFDDMSCKIVPEIYVKGDNKDGISGNGKYIMYDIVDGDLAAIEERVLNTITFYIDKYEKINRVKNFFTILDRFSLCQKILEWESRFQFAKLRLLEQYMQLFENVVDPVESYNIAQRVLDLIEMVPTLDFKSLCFDESYEACISSLKLTTQLVKKLFLFQFEKEKKECLLFHQRFQAIAGINHSDLMFLSEQYDGGSSLSKQTNQQMSTQFQEKLTDGGTQKSTGKNRHNDFSKGGSSGNTQTTISNTPTYWDSANQYDEFCLEKNMEDVFEDIINNNLDEYHLPNVNAPSSSTNAAGAAGKNNLKKASIDDQGGGEEDEEQNPQEVKIRESVVLHKKYEGGPHVLFANPQFPKFKLSPSSEEQVFLNFFGSSSIVMDIMNLIDQVNEDLHSQLPQKSMLAMELQKSAVLKAIISRWNSFDFKEVPFIEDRLICDNESNIQDAVSISVKNSIRTIERNNEIVKEGYQQNTGFDSSDRQFYLSLDYTALNSMANSLAVPQTHNYREMFLNCNMTESLQIRERLLHVLWERKALSGVYKQQFKFLDITVKKHGDLNFPTPIIPSEVTRSAKSSQGGRSPLAYMNEIDNSYDQQYILRESSSVQRFTQSDCVLEFSNIAVFERLIVSALENCVVLNQVRLDPIQTAQFELQLLSTKKCFAENTTLDSRRIFLTTQNIADLLKTIQLYKREIGGEYLYDLKRQIDSIRASFGNVYSDVSSDQKKLPGAAGSILAEKVRQKLKIHLTQLMNEDILYSMNKMWGKVECIHLSRNLRKHLRIVPNISEYVEIPEDNYATGFSRYLYQNQKKKENEINLMRQTSTVVEDSQQYNRIYIHSDELITSKEFLDSLSSSDDKKTLALRSFDSIQLMSLLESNSETQIKKEDTLLTQRQRQSNEQKVLGLLLKVSGDKLSDYGRYQYIDDATSLINSMNLMYKTFLEFLQVHFKNIELCLDSSELKILQEQLLFNLTFTEFTASSDTSSKAKQTSEIDISDSLHCFDQMQAEAAKRQFLSVQGNSNPIRENLKIVNRIIDGLVRKLQGFSNMEESFKRMNVDFVHFNKLIAYTVQQPQQQLLDSSKLRGGIPAAAPNNTNKTDKMQQISEAHKYQLSVSFCQKAQKELQQFSTLFHNKIYNNIFESFSSQCLTDPNTPLIYNFFRLNSNLIQLQEKNRLNLKFFNTQFYAKKTPNAYMTPLNKHELRNIKPIYRKQQNSLYLRLRLLFASLPISLNKSIFRYQEREHFYLGVSEELFKPMKGGQDSRFNVKKLICTYTLPAVGLVNYGKSNTEFIRTLMNLKEEERSRIAGKIRNFEKQITPIKVYKEESVDVVTHESEYVQVSVQNKVLAQALSIYSKEIDYPIVPMQLSQYIQQAKNGFDDKIQEVKNNLDEYKKNSFRIKNEHLTTPFAPEMISENQDFERTHSHLLSVCLEKTFMLDEVYRMMVTDSISTLESEFSVVNLAEGVKVQWEMRKAKAAEQQASNPQGANQVQVNPCYSSPLFLDPKQDVIVPSVTKLYYVQAFINRLRNKATRVDLLSSGFGFVVSVNDLEDCIQFLSKIIWQDGDKEMKLKNDSWRALYMLQNSQIKALTLQKSAMKHSIKMNEKHQERFINSQVHEKGNNLIYEMHRTKRTQQDTTRFLNEIEGNVKLELRKEMNADINQLLNEKQLLRNAFMEFKKLITVSFAHEIKTAGRDIESQMNKKTIEFINQMNRFQQQVLDGNGMSLIDTGLTLNHRDSLLVHQEDAQLNQLGGSTKSPFYSKRGSITRLGSSQYDDEIDKLIDPVVITERINKQRVFYNLKMGLQKSKLEEIINAQKIEISQFSDIQSKLIESLQEGKLIKQELINAHDSLTDQEKKMTLLTNELQIANFEKVKQEKTLDDLKKRVKSLEAELKSALKQDDVSKGFEKTIRDKDQQIQALIRNEKEMKRTILSLSSANKRLQGVGGETDSRPVTSSTGNQFALAGINTQNTEYAENDGISGLKLREITKERDALLDLVGQLKRELYKIPEMSQNINVVSLISSIEGNRRRSEQAYMMRRTAEQQSISTQLDLVLQSLEQKGIQKTMLSTFSRSPDQISAILSTSTRVKTESYDDEVAREKQERDINLLYQTKRSQMRGESLSDGKTVRARSRFKSSSGAPEQLPSIFDSKKTEVTPNKSIRNDSTKGNLNKSFY